MSKKLGLILIVATVLSSCYKYNKPEKPERLLSKQEMAHILIDLRLINAVTGLDKKVLDSAHVTSEMYVLKKYNVDSTLFAKNNAYYAYYAEDYEVIYTMVKDSLDKLKAHYTEILETQEREKKIQDSLKRVAKELEMKQVTPELDVQELIEPISDSVPKSK